MPVSGWGWRRALVGLCMLAMVGFTSACWPLELLDSLARPGAASPNARPQPQPSLPLDASEREPAAANTPVETPSGRVTPMAADTGSHLGAASYTAEGIPRVALRAYRNASRLLARSDPTCKLHWSLLAAIGRVESDHGRYGGSTVYRSGDTQPEILGLVLDGSGATARITDTDGGAYDGDTTFDRAVGPMQFLPGTWGLVGADGNGDGKADPNNVFDAALSAGRYLCAGAVDLSQAGQLRDAVYSYNHSWSYVNLVLGIAADYRAGTAVTAMPPVAPDVRPPEPFDPPAHEELPPVSSGEPPAARHAQGDGPGPRAGRGDGGDSARPTEPREDQTRKAGTDGDTRRPDPGKSDSQGQPDGKKGGPDGPSAKPPGGGDSPPPGGGDSKPPGGGNSPPPGGGNSPPPGGGNSPPPDKPAPELRVTGLTPDQGAGGSAVTVTGSGLEGATVLVGGERARVSSRTDKKIEVVVPPRARAGAVDVSVRGPGGKTSAPDFTYLPAVAEIDPPTGSTAGGATATVTGSGLKDATASFGGREATRVSSSGTELVVRVPAAKRPGEVAVTVSSGALTAKGSATFTYHPEVTDAPESATTGTNVELHGSGFGDDSTVVLTRQDGEFLARQESERPEAGILVVAIPEDLGPGTYDLSVVTAGVASPPVQLEIERTQQSGKPSPSSTR